jgi:hypothetical protein
MNTIELNNTDILHDAMEYRREQVIKELRLAISNIEGIGKNFDKFDDHIDNALRHREVWGNMFRKQFNTAAFDNSHGGDQHEGN